MDRRERAQYTQHTGVRISATYQSETEDRTSFYESQNGGCNLDQKPKRPPHIIMQENVRNGSCCASGMSMMFVISFTQFMH